jgi:hypothetical protein
MSANTSRAGGPAGGRGKTGKERQCLNLLLLLNVMGSSLEAGSYPPTRLPNRRRSRSVNYSATQRAQPSTVLRATQLDKQRLRSSRCVTAKSPLLSDLCSNPVLAGQQPLSSRQVHRYHHGRRAAVASSKVPKIAHGECRTRAPYLSYPPAFARGKERFRNRRRLPEPNAFAKNLV